jgi:hypothetical protein
LKQSNKKQLKMLTESLKDYLKSCAESIFRICVCVCVREREREREGNLSLSSPLPLCVRELCKHTTNEKRILKITVSVYGCGLERRRGREYGVQSTEK